MAAPAALLLLSALPAKASACATGGALAWAQVSAVVEGIGDHGCEYMTGGQVIVLGSPGRNFAAGMSGGIAYVLDPDGDFYRRCNQKMVELSGLDDGPEAEAVRDLVFHHSEYTR